MGMFDKRIDNNLKMVDHIIRQYWDLEENAPEKAKKEEAK